MFYDLDFGAYVDGEYRSQFHPDAFLWVDTFESNVDDSYGYLVRDSSAEPGDAVCEEFLQDQTGSYRRSTINRDNLAFLADDALDDISTTPLEAPAPALAREIWDDVDLTPELQIVEGVRTRQSDLTPAQLGSIRQLLPDPAGAPQSYTSASMTTTETKDGLTTSVVVVASKLDDETTVEFEGQTYQQQLIETLTIEITLGPKASDQDRVSPDATLMSAGGCRPPSERSIGTWGLISVLDDEGQVDLLDGESGFLEVRADGSITGEIGCRPFAGASEFGFFEQIEVDLVVDDATCDAMSDREASVVAMLETSPAIWANVRNRLFVVEKDVDGNAVLVATFAPHAS